MWILRNGVAVLPEVVLASAAILLPDMPGVCSKGVRAMDMNETFRKGIGEAEEHLDEALRRFEEGATGWPWACVALGKVIGTVIQLVKVIENAQKQTGTNQK
jgi:hypothetical protein